MSQSQPLTDNQRILSWIHVLVYAPLLLYVGFYKEDVHENTYAFLFLLTMAVIIYHLYRLHQTQSPVNLFHLLVILPAVFWVATKQKNSGNYAFTVVFFIGLTALFFHAQRLYSR